MEEVIFGNSQGEGLILEHGKTLADFFEIDKSDIALGDTVLKFDEETTLSGWFDSPVKYCGKVKENTLIFLLGSAGGDLFEEAKTYYETMLWVSPTRFFRMYYRNAGRDFNFVKGRWK